MRISHKARPVPSAIEEVFLEISGSAGQSVVLLESQTVKLPFTFTWLRPVIVLPTALCNGGDSQELRFCLAHEWSHIERRDARAWNLAAVAGFVLFYQPMYWWLRRQLRLCQDYLADDRASGAGVGGRLRNVSRPPGADASNRFCLAGAGGQRPAVESVPENSHARPGP